MNKTAVVILNYNGREFLRKFLPSVIQYTSFARIVVADNHSTDDSVEVVRTQFPSVELISISSNLGFCGGYNYALGKIDAEYYLLLNSDVEVTDGWLAPMIAHLDAHPTIGAIQPKILAYHNRGQFEYAGAGGGFIDSLGYPFCRGRIFDFVEADRGQYNDTRRVFWATGACMLLRSKLYHDLGRFDENFFAHMEEIDLCWRIQRAGYEVHYMGQCHVYHVGGGTLSKSNPRKTYLNFRNGLSLIFKNLPAIELWWKLPVRCILDWTAALAFLARGSGRDSVAVLKAHVHFVLGLRADYRKRSMAEGKAGFTPLIYRGSIVFDYFLKGKKTFDQLRF